MILISHRGNLNGKNYLMENKSKYVDFALNKGYNVEVDVWLVGGEVYLGHDKPDEKININYLRNKNIWCHCKNVDALNLMIKEKIHCFFHIEDDVTLTSSNYLWTYPGKKITDNSIVVLPERLENKSIDFSNAAGICSDYIENYKTLKKGDN